MFQVLLKPLTESLTMVLSAGTTSVLLGVPLGLLMLHGTNVLPALSRKLNFALMLGIRSAASLPYLLILLCLSPATEWLQARLIPPSWAAILPLTAIGLLLVAQQTLSIFTPIAKETLDLVKLVGATPKQALFHIILPEGRATLVRAIPSVFTKLLACSLIAGAFGAGGLGALAIEHTLKTPQPKILLAITALVLSLILVLERGGIVIAERIAKR